MTYWSYHFSFLHHSKIYHHSLCITYITISTLLTLEPCIWPSSPRVLRNSVVRASIPVGDSYFSLSRVSARDMLITSCLISSPSLKITIIFYLSHTWRFRRCTDPRNTQDACHTCHEPCIWPSSARAQWLDYPTVVLKVIGSIPVDDSDFFLV